MNKLNSFNWDEYFERKQNLLFNLWVEDFEVKVEKARHRELAIRIHATPYLITQVKTNPFEDFTWAKDYTSQIFNQLEANFFSKAYAVFKLNWLLIKDNPLSTFINTDLQELTRTYLVLLYQQVNDWEMMELADALASEYVNNTRLLRKGVVRWLIEKFAFERMTHFLFNKYNVTVESLTEYNELVTVNVGLLYQENREPINLSKEEDQVLTQFVKKHPRAVKQLLPKRESTLDKMEQIHTTYNLFINRGYSHKEAVIETKEVEDISESTIYRAIKSMRK